MDARYGSVRNFTGRSNRLRVELKARQTDQYDGFLGIMCNLFYSKMNLCCLHKYVDVLSKVVGLAASES